MSSTESIYYYDFLNNNKAPKSGQHGGMKGDGIIPSEANLDTINSNHVHNDDWNKSVNDRQTHTFDKNIAASNQ